jgi:DNA-binding transcriptional LysR family regulator
MAQVEAGRAEMAERIGLRRGRATVGTPPTVGTQLLPTVLAAFNKQYPGIELRLHEAGVQTLLDLLETGLTDVAVVTLPVEDEHLTVVPIFTEEMVVAVWKGHSLAGGEEVSIRQLQQEPWVLSPENYELREATLSACAAAGFVPRVVLDGGETDTLLRFVAAGIGVALVPRLAVNGDRELAILRVVDQRLTRTLGIVWRGDRVASPAARALREFLVEQLRRA